MAAAKPKRLTSDAEADAELARIGAIDRELAAIEAKKSAIVAEAAKAAEASATPLIDERYAALDRLAAYCRKHRKRLTDGDKQKFAEFPAGRVLWRMGRDTVAIDWAEKKTIVARLKKLGKKFARFLRVVEEPAKAALGQATDEERKILKRIPGIAFVPGTEAFLVEPVAMTLADRPPPEEEAA